ncbi:hypothetical protein WICPIJ_002459 [Wickerhamomyces pijperi]|uniref:Uncharacterized protein n=1 Tax=Wickerhamomyces pijperi TaxID=599730 RepID=A0A9P8Q9S1_WICPI|nr:hypothetical protein WICPIJ_002459 [Wickerhamomyces pijperi]
MKLRPIPYWIPTRLSSLAWQTKGQTKFNSNLAIGCLKTNPVPTVMEGLPRTSVRFSNTVSSLFKLERFPTLMNPWPSNPFEVPWKSLKIPGIRWNKEIPELKYTSPPSVSWYCRGPSPL